jgi:hypothetical protein
MASQAHPAGTRHELSADEGKSVLGADEMGDNLRERPVVCRLRRLERHREGSDVPGVRSVGGGVGVPG